jgi:ferredoxin
MRRLYPERRLLRRAEGFWAGGERLLNRLTASPFNPLFHLGVLSIFLLIVLTVTGAYLTIFYRPGADRAYATVATIDASWLGSLMRTIHRYAADGLIVTVVLHALKMLLSDRFWGSRWLSWVSGWFMLALIWLLGVMGYWLVWDQRAQWLTEHGMNLLKGPVALTFASAESQRQAATFFVIVLFLHVFLSVLIVIGLLFHLMRLSRPRVWAPRWLMIEASIALAILAIWRPAVSAPPADPGRTVGTITLDGWYLGFLPLAEGWGSGLFWGASGLLFVALLALPWLARGRSRGPAVVIEDACTGCSVCVQECPYGAIEMRPRPAGARYPSLAVVNPALCTGCGLCVGACATEGIDLPGVPAAIVREQLKRALADASAASPPPIVVFACQGHLARGTVPFRPAPAPGALAPAEQPGQPVGGAAAGSSWPGVVIPLIDATTPRSHVTPGFWSGGKAQPALPLVACELPCIGMLQPEMIRDGMGGGARAVVVLTGPDHDCGFREGPYWLVERLERRKSLVRQGVYVLAAATGDQAPLNALLARFAQEQAPPAEDQPVLKGAPVGGRRMGVSFAAGLAALLLAFGLSLAVDLPITATPPEQAMIRVGLAHTAQLKGASAGLSDSMQSKLPPGVSAEQLVGGERFPVRIRLEIDGATVAEREYRPGGLRQEGAAYALESWPLASGRHQVRLWLMDDGANWREAFAGPIELEAGRVATLIYDSGRAAFVPR